MRLTSEDWIDGAAIDPKYAFGRRDPATMMRFSENLSPQLSWSELPAGTRSLALLCLDPDVPAVADHVNQAGHELPSDLPRTDFCHWSMANLDPALGQLTRGQCSNGVVVGGKRQPPGPAGSVQGVNDYTAFLADSPEMAGTYWGYDGPCPPWNDLRRHRYQITLYALDVATLDVSFGFTVAALHAAMDGHVLAHASLTGTYSLHPSLHDQ
jgi:Raf kinase inhibitor-like YbhB/YbcL family protein